jgi:hypothetical protein
VRKPRHAKNESGCCYCDNAINFQEIQHGLPPAKNTNGSIRDQREPANEQQDREEKYREYHKIHSRHTLCYRMPDLRSLKEMKNSGYKIRSSAAPIRSSESELNSELRFANSERFDCPIAERGIPAADRCERPA